MAKGTWIFIRKKIHLQLHVYSRKGSYFMVSWMQWIIALSTIDSEYIWAAKASKERIWLINSCVVNLDS